MPKRIPETDPAFIAAVGKLICEQRDGLAALTDIVRTVVVALQEPDAEARTRGLTKALANLGNTKASATPQTTAEAVQRAERAGYYER